MFQANFSFFDTILFSLLDEPVEYTRSSFVKVKWVGIVCESGVVGTHCNCVCERRGLGKSVPEGKGVTTETEGNDQHIDVSLE